MTQSHMQLGKNGVTDSFIQSVRDHFVKHETIKVSVLKGAGHERSKMDEYAKGIVDRLGKNFTAKVVGFTIFLRKWRKNVR